MREYIVGVVGVPTGAYRLLRLGHTAKRFIAVWYAVAHHCIDAKSTPAAIDFAMSTILSRT